MYKTAILFTSKNTVPVHRHGWCSRGHTWFHRPSWSPSNHSKKYIQAYLFVHITVLDLQSINYRIKVNLVQYTENIPGDVAICSSMVDHYRPVIENMKKQLQIIATTWRLLAALQIRIGSELTCSPNRFPETAFQVRTANFLKLKSGMFSRQEFENFL
jgi:hypothetical protein